MNVWYVCVVQCTVYKKNLHGLTVLNKLKGTVKQHPFEQSDIFLYWDQKKDVGLFV